MNSKKTKKLKGSVLFTTLTVMFVMVVLVMTTIALAGAASKRAYSNWYDNQTNYTAQSLVDSVVDSFKKGGDNESLGITVVDSLNNPGDFVDVDVTDTNGSNYISGYGRVESLRFEYVADNGLSGDKHYYINGTSSSDIGKMIIKVTAQVSMADGKSKSTYSKYVMGDYQGTASSGNGPGGFNALRTNKTGSGTNDASSNYGKTYAGIVDPVVGDYVFSNQSKMAGDIFIRMDDPDNNKLYNNGSVDDYALIFGRNDPFHNSYSGLRVEGNIDLNGGFKVRSCYPKADGSNVMTGSGADGLNNIPYIYTSKKFSVGAGGQLSVYDGILNIFCDNFSIDGNGIQYVSSTEGGRNGSLNLISLGTSETSYINQTKSNLINWTKATINPDETGKNAASYGLPSGNIYCSGSLFLHGGAVVDGDLYVGKDLSLGGNITVNGTVVVKGSTTGGTIEAKAENNTEAMKKSLENAFADAILKKKTGINGSGSSLEAFQTLENIQSSFNASVTGTAPDLKTTIDGAKTESAQHENVPAGAEGISITAANNVGDNIYHLKGNSFIFGKKTRDFLSTDNFGSDKVLFIQPERAEPIYIDLTEDFAGGTVTEHQYYDEISQTTILHAMIVIDDSYGCEIFVNGKLLAVDKSAIVNLTYAKLLYPDVYNSIITNVPSAKKTEYDKVSRNAADQIELCAQYPKGSIMCPKITIYAAPGNPCFVHFSNASVITADFIMPDGVFKKMAQGAKFDVKYNYNTADNAGNIISQNTIEIEDSEKDLSVIGSLAFSQINATNYLGYFYVDEIKGGTPIDDEQKNYAWADIDGYSNF